MTTRHATVTAVAAWHAHLPFVPCRFCFLPTVYDAPARTASQDGKLPLHYAAVKGAPFEVMELLFEANREAAIANDKARSSADAHAAPHTLPPRSSLCPPSKAALVTALRTGREAAAALRRSSGRVIGDSTAPARGSEQRRHGRRSGQGTPHCPHAPMHALPSPHLGRHLPLLSPLTPELLGALAETAFRARCKVGREAATPRRCPERRAV